MNSKEYFKQAFALLYNDNLYYTGQEVLTYLGRYTTSQSDLQIAVNFGEKAIQETFDKLFNDYKEDIVCFTELYIAVNHLSWEFSEKNKELSRIFSDLFYQLENWYDKNYKTFTKEEQKYFLRMVD